MAIPYIPMPDLKALKRELLYIPATGEFMWLSGKHGRRAGASAGGMARYRYLQFDNRSYHAARLAYYMMTGIDPADNDIDHIDRDPKNNSWGNLRLVNRGQNLCNRSAYNATGMKGIRTHQKKDGSTVYQVILWDSEEKKARYYGTFSTPEEARLQVALAYAEMGTLEYQPAEVQAPLVAARTNTNETEIEVAL